MRLAKTADVVIENSRPGSMDRLGLGWEQLKSQNPALVYCSITGLGSWGPESNQPTYDAVAQALSGLWSQYTDLSNPEPVGPPMADQLTGLYAAFVILLRIIEIPYLRSLKFPSLLASLRRMSTHQEQAVTGVNCATWIVVKSTEVHFFVLNQLGRI